MDNEKQDLEKQLLSILEKKESFSKELHSFQKEFKILSDNINHHISVVNDLTVSENRILRKLHQLESSNINSEISNSLKNGIIDKIKSIFNPKIKITEKITPLLEQPKPLKIEEIKSQNASGNKDIIENQDPSLAKLLTEEIMNEDWPLLSEIEETRFSLKNKQKQKSKGSTQKEKVVISSTSEIKPKVKKTARKTAIKKLTTIDDVDKAIALVAKESSNEIATDSNVNLSEKETNMINNVEVKDTVEIQTSDEQILEKPTSKKEGLMLWVKFENPEYKEEKIAELHAKYSNFLVAKFENLSSEYIYSIKGPSFKLALRKILSLENEF